MNDAIPFSWLVIGGVLCGLLLGALGLLLFLRRRRTLGRLLQKISWEQLADVIIPDDIDGEIHLDLALLTPRGILVLEVRRASGTLFWGDQLDSWTVLDGSRRSVIPNPLPGMRARRHAVHALAPRVPVDGRVLLLGPVTISGETPPGVMLAEELVTAFPARGKESPPPALREAWAELKAKARPI